MARQEKVSAVAARRAAGDGAVTEQARVLAGDLGRRIDGEVRFDAGDRALYAADLSAYRQVPVGVVIPRSFDDVDATVAVCREHQVPILGRGAGTSLAGQCCNAAVVIDFSKYLNRIEHIDPDEGWARVQPGVINEQLRKAAKAYDLDFPPDPATKEYCTLGGNIGNNSCGTHTIMGGKTVENTLALDVLCYDGTRLNLGETGEADYRRVVAGGGRPAEIYQRLRTLRDRYADLIRGRYPDIPRRVSGYNLDELLPERGFHLARALVGSESTCAVTMGATVRLIASPPKRSLLVIGYRELGAAGDHAPVIRAMRPCGLEGVHCHVIENMRRSGKATPGARYYPPGRTWLLVEFGGWSQDEADAAARKAERKLRRLGGFTDIHHITDPAQQSEVWEIRKNGVGSSRVPGAEEAWPSWEDSAVPPDNLGDYLRAFSRLVDRFGYDCTLFGHFGDGCIHTRLTFDFRTVAGLAKFRAFMEEAADLVLAHGGSLSGEHGDGQARSELLPKMFGPELIEAFREFKAIWDPDGKMNPGKVVDPYPLDTNLRTGPDYRPQPVETHFKFPDDHGSFAHATERCFGVGKCRRLEGGTMCPSFMATREEMHSTRGRAHLLFEMLRGDAITDGWRNETVREALDLCLQCKGCKGDCPVSVDVATYKAEFLAHYYKGRLRPPAAYSMGLLFRWAPVAAAMPGLVNSVLATPGLGDGLKALAGFTTERATPRFAPETFQAWFSRTRRNGDDDARPPVVLWPDTFNNYFLTETAKAAVEVLEDAGFQVLVPEQRVCCGRTLYDYGMLDTAKRQLRHAMAVLEPAIRTGIPVIGLEPSCTAVFRDELVNLFPDDLDARRLASQTFQFGEFLARTDEWRAPRLEGRAVVHRHCHDKALLDREAAAKVLGATGLDAAMLQTGCCGGAGSFGYEREHYDVSMAVGEHDVLPKVRQTPPDALVVADGFSCRQQIEHGTGRRPLHLAEVLRLGLKDGAGGRDYLPERHCPQPVARISAGEAVVAGLVLMGLVAGGAALLRRKRT